MHRGARWLPSASRALVTIGGYNVQNTVAPSRARPPRCTSAATGTSGTSTPSAGALGLEQNRRELCRLLWQEWSPGWHFEDATFDLTAPSFHNPDFVPVVIHSYRHRHGNAPGDPRFDAIERRLAARPPITVPTIVLHGGNDGVSGPPARREPSWRSSRPGPSGGSWPAWATSCPASGRPRWWRHFRPFSDRLSAMRIEIICTGDEVLTGKITNTNFGYMSQKLEDVGLSVAWETTVGDDRESLLLAFQLASERADAVIVNGGLGPTVDDLSQEIAAKAAGVELALNEEWLARMEEFFQRRSRVMPPNNKKQAMLPTTAEIIDNPVGTACGFALDIGRARFFFTPGVPRELKRMIEEQIIPRLLKRSGLQTAIFLKRFHSYGLGESHVDSLLTGVDELVPDGSVKLGFRAHYPQLETKLTVRGTDMDDVRRKLAPVEREVRKRLGNFILGEDEQTLEGVVLAALAERQGSLAIVETFTSGQIAARVGHLPGAEKIVRRAIVSRDLAQVCGGVGLSPVPAGRAHAGHGGSGGAGRAPPDGRHPRAGRAHRSGRGRGPDRPRRHHLPGHRHRGRLASRRSRILGGREWVRLGAVELGLDCLRRHLQGLPVVERIDFEKT